MSDIALRDFRDTDAMQVNRVALAAFDEFKSEYTDWPAMVSGVARMSALAEAGEIIVAERDDTIVGAVAYIPPGCPKAPYFDRSWPIVRMLVVDPACRGHGVGRALTEECIERARRDGSRVMALHTSPIMTVALPLYIRMGFRLLRDAPPILDAPYAVYLREIPD
jgi:ribosomal protein S18 acetylase RimI-like enzyme